MIFYKMDSLTLTLQCHLVNKLDYLHNYQHAYALDSLLQNFFVKKK